MDYRKDSILEVFKQHTAILEGHFLLSSGLHSDRYLQCARILQYPELAEKVGAWVFEVIKDKHPNWDKITCVVSPALGGVVIGQEVARAIKTFTGNNVRAIFTERDSEGKMQLRRGFAVSEKDAILVVEDVVTTGKSTKEVIEVVETFGGKVSALSSIFKRGSAELGFKQPHYYVAMVEVQSWPAEQCPLCKQGIPAVKPGSRKDA